MATVGQLKRALEDKVDSEPVAYDLWFAGDVLSVAQEMQIELTTDEVHNVLAGMQANRDASIGLNWDTVKAEIANERS